MRPMADFLLARPRDVPDHSGYRGGRDAEGRLHIALPQAPQPSQVRFHKGRVAMRVLGLPYGFTFVFPDFPFATSQMEHLTSSWPFLSTLPWCTSCKEKTTTKNEVKT